MVKNWRKLAAPSGIVLAAMLGMTAAAPGARADDAQSYIAHAKALLAKGDLKGAEIELRNAVRADPNDASAHVDLARLYFQAGNLPAAEAEARLARQGKASPDDVDPVLAQTLVAEGKFNALFDLVKPGKRSAKAESEVQLQLGLAHLALGETTEAEPLLRNAERLDDTSIGAKVAMARLLMQKGDSDDADAELARARALKPDDLPMLRLSGELLSSKGDQAGAVTQFGAILAKHPDDLQTLLDRANVLMSVGKLDEAQKDIDHALKLQPKSVIGNFLYALYLSKKGDLKQADDRLTAISEYFNAFPDGYYLEGAVQYALGEYAEAEANLTKYAVRNPTFSPARRLLALIALRRHDYAHMIDLLQPVVDAHSSDTAAIGLLARAYLATGKRDQAMQLLQKASQAMVDDTRGQTQLALLQMQIGETAEGLTALHSLAKTASGADVAGPVLVLTDLRQGRTAEAANEAEDLVKQNDKDYVAQNLLGIVRMQQQNYPAAEKIFKDLADGHPDLIVVQRNLAQVYTAMNRLEDAKKAWNAVLKQAPNDAPALTGLAGLAQRAGDYDRAATLLTQAEKAAPNDPSSGMQLVRLYWQQKKWNEAKNASRDLEGRFPANPAIIELIAEMDSDSGDPRGAVDEYQKAIQALPNSARAYEKFGAFQIGAGDKNGARESITKAISLAPGNILYMQELVNLDYAMKGADAALATAQSFAVPRPDESAVLAADVLVRSKKSPAAITLLQHAQQEHPSSLVLVRLAQLTYQQSHGAGVQAMLESWIEDHKDDTSARIALGELFMAKNDFDKAQAEFEPAYKSAPRNAVLLNDLAIIYLQKRDPRARGLAEEAYHLAPMPEIADTLGWVLVSTGNAEDGLLYLQRAEARLSSDPTVEYHLAVALQATGDKAQARSLFERVVKSGASFGDKADAQRRLETLDHG